MSVLTIHSLFTWALVLYTGLALAAIIAAFCVLKPARWRASAALLCGLMAAFMVWQGTARPPAGLRRPHRPRRAGTAAWIQWSAAAGGNDHFYALTPAATNWAAAQSLAVARGAALAAITSPQEQEFINATFLTGAFEHRPLWIGLVRAAGDGASPGAFQWVTGEPLAYSNWKPGEPNNMPPGETCVAINWEYSGQPPRGVKGDWNDTPQNGTTGFGGATDGPYFGLMERRAAPARRPAALTVSPASIPMGQLAFVTSANFGSPGRIRVVAGHDLTTTLAYTTRELEFLPDGRRILYCASDSQATGIYLYDLAQQANIPLITNVATAAAPSLSPDGARLAFVVWPASRQSSQICTANTDGSALQQLTDGPYFNWTPRWSPDGRKLVFETTRDGNREIYAMDGDGQNQTNLTKNPYLNHHPSWSPDGRFIAYMAPGENGKAGIFVMKSDGSAKQNISQGRTRDSEPAWSPDGRWIAFTRTADHPPGPETMDIWIMKSDGTGQRPVTFNQAGFASYCPSWSH